MVLSKQQKFELVKWMSQILKDSKSVTFVQLQGLSVNDATELRSKLREGKVGCKVVKNTLLTRAAKEANFDFGLDEAKGKTIALAFSSEDEIQPSKIVYNFSRNNKAVKLIGGVVNAEYIDESKILELAKLPGREELYVKVVGSLSAPISGMVNVLAGNLRGLVSILSQYKDQKAK